MVTMPDIAVSSHSEYPLKTWVALQPNFDLHSDTDALWVEGIGDIAQYHCYYDMLYTHGVIYYLRDSTHAEIISKTDAGEPLDCIRPLIERLDRLNSKITAYEHTKDANCDPNSTPSHGAPTCVHHGAT